MRRGDRITEVYAYICLDQADDCEGIPAFAGPHPNDPNATMFMPMVGADRERMLALLPMARQMVKVTGKKMRVVRFTHIEEIEEVAP
jgi:hypothetical protein